MAPAAANAGARAYDIVYVRQPRFGDSANTPWPEVALLREWAYHRAYATSARRRRALAPWVRYYNRK
jgi:hypothetical protein